MNQEHWDSSTLQPDCEHFAQQWGDGWVSLVFPQFHGWGSIPALPSCYHGGVVVDLISRSFLLAVDPCLSLLRAFISMLMQFYSSDFCGQADSWLRGSWWKLVTEN